MVLITNMDLTVAALAQLYRDRADVENCFDELKNQWGWGGFTTRDVARSQSMAQMVALIYNWWSLFVGLIEPEKHAEAITSRPELLHGVARVTQSARQTTVTVTSTHQKAAQTQAKQSWVGRFLSQLREAAEQLSRADIWRLILIRVFVRFLRGRIIGCPAAASVPAFA
ncbi:MAG: transposase [Chthoniobacteraceae bacterium]